uniref:Uncharacterized protein n=1 Tax=Parascaris univalens TaxID=6257 RepID=A0A915BFZ1_PARUN
IDVTSLCDTLLRTSNHVLYCAVTTYLCFKDEFFIYIAVLPDNLTSFPALIRCKISHEWEIGCLFFLISSLWTIRFMCFREFYICNAHYDMVMVVRMYVHVFICLSVYL